MKTMMMTAVLVMCLLCGGCGALVIHPPVPIGQKEDYRQEYTHGGKDSFYHSSRLLIVNASQYKIRLVKNGTELPMFYMPRTEGEIKVKNQLYEDVVVRMLAVAYSRYGGAVIGTAEREFRFNGTGQQQVEQWVLKDWMFER